MRALVHEDREAGVHWTHEQERGDGRHEAPVHAAVGQECCPEPDHEDRASVAPIVNVTKRRPQLRDRYTVGQ